MATGKRPPSGNERRRRPPTVINLEATEVQTSPAEAKPEPKPEAKPELGSEAPAPQMAPPDRPDASSTPEPALQPESEPVRAADEAFIPPPPERPQSAAGHGAPPPEPPVGPAPNSFGWRPDQLPWSQIGASIAGALLVVLLLWLAGALPGGGRETAADLSPRLGAIEGQLQALTARPQAQGIDPKAIEELNARLGRLEAAQSAPRAPTTDPVVLSRLSAAEQGAKSLADNVAALARRSDSVEGALRETQARVGRISTALDEVRSAARSVAAGSDRAARLALAASALRTAVEHGDPFTAELAAIKPLTADAAAIARLEPFAAKGIPSNAALAQELTGLVKPMLHASAGPRRDGGFLERLQANAENLVRVRPVGDAPGDDRGAILARVEQRAAQANVVGAVAEVAKLPANEREPLQPWLGKIEARDAAVEATRRLSAEAVAALKAAP